MLLHGLSGLVWAVTGLPYILRQTFSVFGRGPVHHLYLAWFFFIFSHRLFFFQLELLMASVMVQWPDHRGLWCCCGPWQHCWLWEDFHPIYLKCHGDAFIFRLRSHLISRLPVGVSIFHIDLSSQTVYVATLSVYLSVFECLLSWQWTLPFCPHNGAEMCIAVLNLWNSY